MRFFIICFLALFLFSCQSTSDVEVLELNVEKNLIPEGITVHPKTGQIYLSSVHLNKIVHCDNDGQNEKDLFASGEFGYSAGVGMEATNKILYALGGDSLTGQSKLYLFDFFDNKLFAALGVRDDSDVYLNDLTVTQSGKVYMTDTRNSKIMLYNTETAQMELFLKHPQIKFPNGITISPDETKLYIDSYTSGIRVVDIKTKKILNELHTASAKKGIDGLKFYNDCLYGIVNGKKTPKEEHGLMKFELSEDLTNVLEASPVLLNHPTMNTPTTFDIVGDDFYILANSQIGNLDQEKGEIIDSTKLTNTFILKMKVKE